MLTRWPECGPIKCRFRVHPQMRSIDPAAFESSSSHSLARMKNVNASSAVVQFGVCQNFGLEANPIKLDLKDEALLEVNKVY